jgi:hypothetical protein
MATVHMRLTYNIQDSEGVRAPATLYGTYDDSMTVATLATDIGVFKALVAAATDGQIIGSEATLMASGAAAPGAFADSDVSQVAVYDFRNTAGRLHGVVIPAAEDASITAGHINLADTDIAALVATLGDTVGNFLMTDPNWLRTGALIDAFLSTRKHRRALKRSSFEVPAS